VVNEPAVALKFALLALAAIDTVAGTVILPVELNATVAAEATAPVIVTVQTATAAGASDGGVHESPLKTGVVDEVVAVPPAVLVVIGVLSNATPIPPETPTEADVVPAARVIATVATLPSEIRLVLMPLAMHT
jgi:hypothetical protein